MPITLLAAGSRGDTQPFIALGLALKRAGCEVRVAASETFRAFVEGYGLDSHAVTGDVTAAALRAGVPSVVVPHAVDQFAWGRRVSELGVEPPPIPRKKLSVVGLAEAVTQALQQGTKHQAGVLGEKIRRESGAEAAAKVIVSCLAQSQLRS